MLFKKLLIVNDKSIQIVSWLLASIPIIYYFYIFFTFTINAPHEDDYDTILNFMVELVQTRTFLDKIWISIIRLSNEHIIFLNHIVSCMQYSITGQINFNQMKLIGSMTVIVTWIYFLKISYNSLSFLHYPKNKNFAYVIFVVLSSILFFNLSYFDSTFSNLSPAKSGGDFNCFYMY